MLETVLHGALARGVNGPTLLLLNVCLVACTLVCASLLLPSVGLPAEVVPHIGVLLLLALGLIASVNWVIVQTGTVSAEEQRRELFGEPAAEQPLLLPAEGAAEGTAPAPADAATPAAADQKDKEQ